MPQLQINQGPQDALLYDNSRSYFTNVGYVRTSNFQTEYKYCDAQQGGVRFGSTATYVIPKAADLLGPVDLVLDLNEPQETGTGSDKALGGAKQPATTTSDGNTNGRVYNQWVDELGFAAIEKITFTIGSVDIQTITGDQLQLQNELMTSDEMRLGFDHVMKTGRRAFLLKDHTLHQPEYSELPGEYLPANPKAVNKDYTRLISVADGGRTISFNNSTASANSSTNAFSVASGEQHGLRVGDRIMITDGLTDNNIAGNLDEDITYLVNDVLDNQRVTLMTTAGALVNVTENQTAAIAAKAEYTHARSGKRQLIVPLGLFFTKHVSQYFPLAAIAGCNDVRISIKFRNFKELVQTYSPGQSASLASTESEVFGSTGAIENARLLCHYVHVTGPEAQALMNKEHVRLLKLWQHTPQIVQSSVFKTGKVELDLNFLHPVSTLLITIRREDDMKTDIDGTGNSAQKGFFFYHGDGTNPNYDRYLTQSGEVHSTTSEHTVKVNSIELSLNGQERHPGLDKGIPVQYLQHRLLPMLHSNSNAKEKQTLGSTGPQEPSVGADANINIEATPEYQRYQMQGSKNIFVYPFSLNPEGSNPSGAVNFSKVSHGKLRIHVEAPTPTTVGPTKEDANGSASSYRVDVYALYYNWLQIKDGRALLSFA